MHRWMRLMAASLAVWFLSAGVVSALIVALVPEAWHRERWIAGAAAVLLAVAILGIARPRRRR